MYEGNQGEETDLIHMKEGVLLRINKILKCLSRRLHCLVLYFLLLFPFKFTHSPSAICVAHLYSYSLGILRVKQVYYCIFQVHTGCVCWFFL
jgi:hypothetical protein